MPRPALLILPLLLAACAQPLPVPPMGGAPRGERDASVDACRAEADRIVSFRERGQTMRADETESGRGTVTVAPFSRAENDRAMAQMDRDRIIQDCLAGARTARR
jgi:hypothetical protein